ncbi:sporulation protein YqfD [Sediminibacillus halophilus]|uniref:Similar to stage IV sporulation protein n=1 Tax=Sediminibacillus halophilus TaxID=482461 RepID=A0A1G9YKR8_9BACI|nr:sporulation protein YqfD [Sediminibacillus halophilus]SDN09065.1 similar to stage IV sporulation protein [Sediminibacillus halophilus]
MKHTQAIFFTGSVKIKVTGHHPELFFGLCAREGITVWNVIKINETQCIGNVRLSDISTIKRLRRQTVYKLSFLSRKGFPFLIQRVLHKKPFVAGLLLSILFVTFLSNIVWDIEVENVPPEVEAKIIEKLDEYGIHPGAVKFTIGTPGDIQQRLLDDLPELLWVGVTEKGTTYQLEAVEKTIVEEPEQSGPRNLVAAKKGVIVDMFVAKGLPLVEVNDFVTPGQVLVSGNLNENQGEQEDDEEKQDKPKNFVAAEGEVIAETWYEVETTVPLKANYQTLTGENETKFKLQIGKMKIPVWGFKKVDYEQVYKETTRKPLYFLHWTLPISIVEEQWNEQAPYNEKRSRKKVRSEAVKQATKQLQTELGKDAEIAFQKVLHERIESGKVKLTLYFKAKEDITKNQPISQGD